jgi:hypothetical protein
MPVAYPRSALWTIPGAGHPLKPPAKGAEDAKERKSFTAKDAKERTSFTAKDAEDAKGQSR